MIPIPDLPELPTSGGGEPQKFAFRNGHGEIFATKNFNNTCPVWRKYKCPGWALRYAEGSRWRDLLTDPRIKEFYECSK